MRTYRPKSWSKQAREITERFIANYNVLKTEEEKAEYKRYIFEELMNPLTSSGLITYWRAPLIQQRIAKRLKRLGV